MKRWGDAALIASVSLALLWWSWGKWPDVLIDFGRELYVAWQLADGKTLYTDLAYFKGPLSPYLNAAVFRLFGSHLLTVVVWNLLILAGIVWMLYRILLAISGRLAATTACLTFVALFGFGQLTGVGNYNFVCPYSHEMTHGVALSLAALGGLLAYHRTRRMLAVAAAGLTTGLVLLTDVSVAVAAVAGVAVGGGLTVWAERPPHRRLAAMLAVFLAGLILPGAVAWLGLSGRMPAARAWEALLRQWMLVGVRGVPELHFHQWSLGLLDWPANVLTLLRWTAGCVGVLGSTAVLSLMAPRLGRARRWVAVAWCAALLIALMVWHDAIQWGKAVRPLPLVLIGLIGTWGALFLRQRPGGLEVSSRSIIAIALCVFSLALLGRIILYVRFWHYGFALAMPGTVVLVIALVGWLPAWLNRAGGSGRLFQAVSLLLIGWVVGSRLQMMDDNFRYKTVVVGKGADAFLADERGLVINEALDVIERTVHPDQTLAVLPEGAMLNYLSRRVSPTPHLTWNPADLFMNGEPEMLQTLTRRPPDYIALVNRDASEHGARLFGLDYGQRISHWIEEHYQPVARVGAPPGSPEIGLQLFRRIEG